MSIPCSFDELKRRSGPPLNAWGLYGPDDELGRLNLITPDSVKRGRDSIQHGIRINLNLSFNSFPSLGPVRPPLRREIEHRVYCIDDIVTFNTQTSTQWDGFRHFAYKHWPEKDVYTYHGGMTEAEALDTTNHKYGTQNYAKHPITSRGVLLDVADLLKATADDEGVTFQPGDICIVRTGWTEAFLSLRDEQREAMTKHRKGTVGVDQDDEVLRWHWESGIAAVVSDTGAYECYPSPKYPSIHEVFLAGWGMPIGELFDLRELAATSARLKQWTFLFTSMGLNIDGGVATPPNAQAIL